jgi:hypothetical protein
MVVSLFLLIPSHKIMFNKKQKRVDDVKNGIASTGRQRKYMTCEVPLACGGGSTWS